MQCPPPFLSAMGEIIPSYSYSYKKRKVEWMISRYIHVGEGVIRLSIFGGKLFDPFMFLVLWPQI